MLFWLVLGPYLHFTLVVSILHVDAVRVLR
jgi:hypothetical protein